MPGKPAVSPRFPGNPPGGAGAWLRLPMTFKSCIGCGGVGLKETSGLGGLSSVPATPTLGASNPHLDLRSRLLLLLSSAAGTGNAPRAGASGSPPNRSGGGGCATGGSGGDRLLPESGNIPSAGAAPEVPSTACTGELQPPRTGSGCSLPLSVFSLRRDRLPSLDSLQTRSSAIPFPEADRPRFLSFRSFLSRFRDRPLLRPLLDLDLSRSRFFLLSLSLSETRLSPAPSFPWSATSSAVGLLRQGGGGCDGLTILSSVPFSASAFSRAKAIHRAIISSAAPPPAAPPSSGALGGDGVL